MLSMTLALAEALWYWC